MTISYNFQIFRLLVSPFLEDRIYSDFGGGDCTDGQVTVVNEELGNILSPNYGANNTGTYPNDANCQWLINVAEGSVVSLAFLEFDVEQGYVQMDVVFFV